MGKLNFLFFLFLAVWVIVCVGLTVFLYRGGNTELKKRIYLPAMGLMGLTFMAFMAVDSRRWDALWFGVPVIALVLYSNSKLTMICDSCGRLVYRGFGARYCAFCGKELKRTQ